MIVKISTLFECSVEQFWQEILKPDSLQYASYPIMTFRPLDGVNLSETWKVGQVYKVKLVFLNLIPLGEHAIKLKEINRETNTIVSNESGRLAPVWNHTIRFNQAFVNMIEYEDEIEIQAGWRTVFIWLFSNWFYRHRQNRWKKRLKELGYGADV